MRSGSRLLQAANRTSLRWRFEGVVLVSDQESWIGTGRDGSTAVMTEWQTFIACPVWLPDCDWIGPKLVSIDLQPYTTTRATDRSDILNAGAFSDSVFSVVAAVEPGGPLCSGP
jgi:60 kDa SS-A/Ro ribonucleoprotein